MKRFIYLVGILILGFTLNDVQIESVLLDWQFVDKSPEAVTNIEDARLESLVLIDENTSLPVYTKIYPVTFNNQDFKCVIENPEFEEWQHDFDTDHLNQLSDEIYIESTKLKSGNSFKLEIKITPLIKKEGKLFRLKSFNLKRIPVQEKSAKIAQYDWKNESVLKDGKWIKISASGKGIFKIPYSKLNEWGFSNPSQVNIFGGVTAVLSENPANIDYDDLLQIAVWHGNTNGTDCIFFYSPGTTLWSYSTDRQYFEHRLNDYSTKNYFFLTEDAGSKKEVEMQTIVEEAATNQISTFDEYVLYEKELSNLLQHGSGKKWYGEKFISGTTNNVNFDLKDLDTNAEFSLRISAVARSLSASEMSVSINQTNKGNLTFDSVNTGDAIAIFANEQEKRFFQNLTGEQLNLALRYSANNSSAEAWLDFVEVNYKRKLRLNDEVLFFRDKESVAGGNIVEFSIEDASDQTKVFDLTDVYNIKEMPLQIEGNIAKFKNSAWKLHEYALFNTNGDFPQPELDGEVENQNLHALNTPEYLIITHPNFINSANALADFHRNYDGMSVEVVQSTKVYNEFSSGAKDATGIRNFIKMLYDRNDGKLKYVLLFGDGSYDNRNINAGSSTLIPTYQSANSLNPTASFVTDDYFVILDDNESVYSGAVDLGIGRIPASTKYEAELVVNKILNYYNSESFGSWRNVVCFIGDDQDGTLHMSDSEKLANIVNNNHKEFITDKIYFDAYMQEATPAGERYPDVNEAINKRVKDGVLVLNYVGHANSRFLADEHVLDVSDINSWSNTTSLPIFVTATCEFSRFDADETSAGEYVLLNPNGGGIGLFSTTRVVFAYSNFLLSRSFYNVVFKKDANGEHYRMGDIIRLAKINTISTTNKRNFSLLADPALKLSYPENKIVTTSINQNTASGQPDTLGALQVVTISGYVADHLDNKIADFSGEIIPTVYDKEVVMQTLGNAGETPMNFKVRENIIYKGRASVSNGDFSFSFVIPKDISYNIGEGKIIYYASNETTDANGAFENFYIGGPSPGLSDDMGPQIDLYLDSPSFQSGNITSKNPTLLAFLSDDNGINTVNTGIGHDIVAVLDEDYSNAFILNNYYLADINDHTRGSIQYPLSNLDAGIHTLKLKAWDVANNSTEVEIEFEVTGEFEILNVVNYPNPVYDFTYFTFEHNLSDETLDAIFEVFDISGRRIDILTTQVGSDGINSSPVRWDLSRLNGRIQNGLYLYRITAQNNDGIIASKSGKMIIAQ